VVDGPVAERDLLDEDEQLEYDFIHEVMDTLVIGIREKTDTDKVALEINGSRYAYNIALERMQTIVFQVI